MSLATHEFVSAKAPRRRALGRQADDKTYRRRNSRHRSARKARRGDGCGDLQCLARPPGAGLPGPKARAGRPDPRHRLFRPDRQAVAAAEIFSQGLLIAPSRHHADLEHPRERRADRRAARRRDDVPPRHDSRRGAEQGDDALLGRRFLRPAATRCSPPAMPPTTRSDPALRQKLEGKKALHHYNYGSTIKGDGRGTAAFSEQTHPVFRTHEDTGRKAVYVNRLMTVKVLDMPEDEKRAAAQRGRTTTPKSANSSTSTSGGSATCLLWDNRCSSHARTDFPSTERRLMLRTTVEGNVRPLILPPYRTPPALTIGPKNPRTSCATPRPFSGR